MMWEYKVTAEMYEQMKAIDIRSVDPDTVPDIKDIRVDITSAAKDRKAKDGGRNWKRQRDDAVICA